ncbi:MAG TPA: redoxin domain-containing protein, partial [Longimicrobiaceae bacterium]|nr:redoxin domain-containing protein [Longimicrobiaceae bacterium]
MAAASTMLELGTPAPHFALRDTDGALVSLDDARGAGALLVMFICNHCPFVQHVLPELGRLDRDYRGKGVGFAAINANDLAGYPQDGPPHMKELALAEGWDFPFLMDETQ